MRDKISEVFDIQPMQRTESNISTMVDVSSDSVKDDAVIARANIRDLIKTGMDALEDSIEVAKATENPRAFEVAFAAMKTLADMNTTLIDIHDREKKVTQESSAQSAQPGNVTNNIAFVGTTKDLNDLIAKRLATIQS